MLPRLPHRDDCESFHCVSLEDFLDLDDRPTFVLDSLQSHDLKPVFVNAALNCQPHLLAEVVRNDDADATRLSFDQWIHGTLPSSVTDFADWQGQSWRRTVLKERWIVLQSIRVRPERGQDSHPTQTRPHPEAQTTEVLRNKSAQSSSSDVTIVEDEVMEHMGLGEGGTAELMTLAPIIDWTIHSIPSPTPFVQFFREFDWASTPLGPINTWPIQLRGLCNTILSDHIANIILWGDSMTMIYNQACVQLFADRHPSALGGFPQDIWSEPWPFLEPMIQATKRTGKVTQQLDMCLPMNRKGFVEETYWNISFLPVIGPDGRAIAICDRFMETTVKVVAERRMSTLLRIGELGASSNDLKVLWSRILQALGQNVNDAPFVAVYSVAVSDISEHSSASSNSDAYPSSKQCVLEGTIGVLEEQDTLPRMIDLSDTAEELVPFLNTAWKSSKPLLLRESDGHFPKCLVLHNKTRGLGDVCEAALIFPIRFTSENTLVSFVVLGVNSRRPYDDDYTGYVQLLHGRLVDAAAKIYLPEEQRRNESLQREESLRQASLASMLLTRTHDAERKQQKFTRLAQNAPIGMGLFDSKVKPIFFNDAHFEMTGMVPGVLSPLAWTDCVHPDDLDYVLSEWKKLANDHIPITLQYRVKKPWKSINKADGTEISGDTWLLSSAFPDLSGDDEVDSAPGTAAMMGWTINISAQKWAESLQRQRLEDALEHKRQSENFIDMTSHEMRNPLSAILQSADGISTIVSGWKESQTSGSSPEHQHQSTKATMDLISESAQTVLLCAQHQKRIVDDILTLSKLDSNLLLITPDKTDPIAVANHVLRMYEAELTSNSINYELNIDSSYSQLRVNTVLLDPSRLLQVIINLMTNAIKFTQQESKRSISLSLAASASRPEVGPKNTTWFPPKTSRSRTTVTPGVMEEDKSVYIIFSIEDSGRGLNSEEKTRLFKRFQQASPRTHVQYGGSGLGLFISRQLTELQGGQIGVQSEFGKGSIFAFYVEAWHCPPGDQRVDAPTISRGAILPEVSATLDIANSQAFKPTPPARSGTSGFLPPSKPDLHVLIVEDNLINQKVMASQLRRLGCTVHVANHGGEALRFLATSTAAAVIGNTPAEKVLVHVDVILMDLEMPVMDGLTCTRRIRELQVAKTLRVHVPIICITANARDAQIREALAAGCDSVVTKPFRIPDLIPQIQKLVNMAK